MKGTDWINLAQDWYKWQAVVKMVINLGFGKMRGIS
jgi:hypothetical protein